MANVKFTTGRPSTVNPLPCGGDSGPHSGHRWRMLSFSKIEVVSSKTNGAVKLF
jgi:hypothetical protein